MTKTIKKGFTIIELLIVIVVIGILAAIVVVTYQGVQNKANTTAAEQNAREVVNKASAFNAVATVYPTWAELKAATPNGTTDTIKEAELSEKVAALIGDNTKTISGATKANKEAIKYIQCLDKTGGNAVGAIALYYDYSNNKIAAVRVGTTKDGTNTCKDEPVNP